VITIRERLEQLRRLADVALEAAFLFGIDTKIEMDGDEEGTLLIDMVGITSEEVEVPAITHTGAVKMPSWYVWKGGYTPATYEDPGDYYDIEICHTRSDSEAVERAILTIVAENIGCALENEFGYRLAGDPDPLDPALKKKYRIQHFGQHLKLFGEHMLRER
jgi:hypothetical protein